MSDAVIHLDDENFAKSISNGVILVDFFADWCGPCRMMTPVIHDLAEEMKGKMAVGKLDIDVSQKTTQQFQVTSIPTLILFKNGVEVERIVGLRDPDSLKAIVKPHIQ